MSDETRDILKNDSGNHPSEDEFLQLFTMNQRRLYLHILSQVPQTADAEEILQNTNIVLWKKFEQFRSGTSFLAWACQVAHFEVLKYRDRQRRDKLMFSDEFIRTVAKEAIENAELLESRRRALAYCLSKLRAKDRELIQKRYAPGVGGKGIAELLGRPVNSVYQSLGRIRRTLIECINRRLAVEMGQ